MSIDVTIGLDCSTTAATAVAWGADGSALAQGTAPLPAVSPAHGRAEQDPLSWWAASAQALRECAAAVGAERVRSLGLTWQRETFVLLDGAGAAVRPAILWYDARAAAQVERLAPVLDPAEYHRQTGKQLDITALLPRLLWLREEEPEVLARACTVADVGAYLSWRLTGRLQTARAGVDTTGLIGLREGSWQRDWLARFGLDTLRLPALLASVETAGELTPAAARETGLPPATPVVLAGGDGHCFAVGAAAAAAGPPAATLTLGTSAVLGLDAALPALGDAFRTLISCLPGRFLLESVIQCGSATLAWHDGVFAGRDGPAATPAEWDAACSRVPPGCLGLAVLPYWRGRRVPAGDALARGVAVGWHDGHTTAAFRRAIMEGIAFEVRQLLDRMRAVTRVPVGRLVVGGGGARADLWCQILADVLELPVCRPATVQLTALGAALCARAATAGDGGLAEAMAAVRLPGSRFLPIAAHTGIYRELAAIHAELYDRNRDLCHRLAALAARPVPAPPATKG